MDQLQYLGSILGLPSISDPCFPMAYASFFGSLPESGKDGGKDSIKDGGERPNVWSCVYVCMCVLSSLYEL